MNSLAAYEELYKQLEGQLERAEQLKIEHARGVSELENATAQVLNSRYRIEALERDCELSAEAANSLNAELAVQKNVVGELTTTNGRLVARVEESDNKLGELEQLTDALRSAQQEASELRGKLAHAEAQAARVGDLHAQALAEAEKRQDQLVASYQDLARKLEAELRSKQTEREAQGGADYPEVLPSQVIFSGERLRDGDHASGDAAPPAEAARRLVASIAGKETVFPLTKNHMTIGRGQSSDIHIDRQFISRVHARISNTRVGTTIEDAGSKNGLLVNLEPITRRRLRHGDVVSLGGELNLRFFDSAR